MELDIERGDSLFGGLFLLGSHHFALVQTGGSVRIFSLRVQDGVYARGVGELQDEGTVQH